MRCEGTNLERQVADREMQMGLRQSAKWVGGEGSETLVPAKGYLKPGDVIECEMEKIGVLRNTVGTA